MILYAYIQIQRDITKPVILMCLLKAKHTHGFIYTNSLYLLVSNKGKTHITSLKEHENQHDRVHRATGSVYFLVSFPLKKHTLTEKQGLLLGMMLL